MFRILNPNSSKNVNNSKTNNNLIPYVVGTSNMKTHSLKSEICNFNDKYKFFTKLSITLNANILEQKAVPGTNT